MIVLNLLVPGALNLFGAIKGYFASFLAQCNHPKAKPLSDRGAVLWQSALTIDTPEVGDNR
jgi:hypothetical protein